MKNLNPKYSILTLIFGMLLSVQNLFANKELPAPKGSEGFDNKWTVGGPIDDYLPLLFIAALLLGVWALNKYKTLDQVKS
jgi:hypothetical protein